MREFIKTIEKIGVVLPKIYDIQQVFNYYDTQKKGKLEYKNISEKIFNKAKNSNSKENKENLEYKNNQNFKNFENKNQFNNEILNDKDKDKDKDSNSFFSAKQRNMLSGIK